MSVMAKPAQREVPPVPPLFVVEEPELAPLGDDVLPDGPLSFEVPIAPEDSDVPVDPEVPELPDDAGALLDGVVDGVPVPAAPLPPGVVPEDDGALPPAGGVVVVVVDDSVLPGVVDGAAGGVAVLAGGVVVVVVVELDPVPPDEGSFPALRLQALRPRPTKAVTNTIFAMLDGAFMVFPFTGN